MKNTTHIIRLGVIAALIGAASATPGGAADPDVYMNSLAPPGACQSGPQPGHEFEWAAVDHARAALSRADADVYLRSEVSTGAAGKHADESAMFLQMLMNWLAGLLH